MNVKQLYYLILKTTEENIFDSLTTKIHIQNFLNQTKFPPDVPHVN